MKNEIIIYQTDELSEHIEVKIDEEKETVWLTQQQIAHLFGIQRPAITKHLGNIFKSGELDEKGGCLKKAASFFIIFKPPILD